MGAVSGGRTVSSRRASLVYYSTLWPASFAGLSHLNGYVRIQRSHMIYCRVTVLYRVSLIPLDRREYQAVP